MLPSPAAPGSSSQLNYLKIWGGRRCVRVSRQNDNVLFRQSGNVLLTGFSLEGGRRTVTDEPGRTRPAGCPEAGEEESDHAEASRRGDRRDWQAQFAQVHTIRRSRRLEAGWEIDHDSLFLAPTLFDELLLVQYLISRSHKAGGLTLEGRYTLAELFARLRNSGYLRAVGVRAQNPADALEQLVTYLGGGETAIKFYHVVDRRDFLEKLKSVKLVRPPRPKVV